MTAQIHAFPALKSQAELDFETIHGDYADDIVLAACARLKHHRNWIYSDRAKAVEAAIIANAFASRARVGLRNIALALGVTLIGAGVGASLVQSYQNFWAVTEWSQAQ